MNTDKTTTTVSALPEKAPADWLRDLETRIANKPVEAKSALLKFGRGNAKLDKEIATFSLPAGYSCPGASACLARADRASGKITDGPLSQFRCFAATAESAYRNVRESRWHNFELLKGKTRDEMSSLILASLPDNQIIRIHVSGDFFNESYFGAWIDVAHARPGTKFYAYTKSIPMWKALASSIPANLILTASEGGKYDAQIGAFKTAKVVFSEEQAAALGLDIDHDDSHAYDGQESFALLLHGTQAKGYGCGQSAHGATAFKHWRLLAIERESGS
jgi:hypothetical protein